MSADLNSCKTVATAISQASSACTSISIPTEEAVQAFDNVASSVRPHVACPLLVAIALSPLAFMLLFVTFLRNVFLAMFAMHGISMTLSPILYITFVSHDWSYYKGFLVAQTKRWRHQIWAVPVVFIVSASMIFGGYILIRCDGPLGICIPLQLNCFTEGMALPTVVLVLLGTYFCLVNPILEESFWRVFLYRELGTVLFLANGDFAHGEQRSIWDYIGGCCPPEERRRPIFFFHRYSSSREDSPPSIVDTTDVRLTEIGYLTLSLLYASYHFVVVFHLMGLVWAILGVSFLALLGRLWIFARNDERFGILTAIASHMGVDVGVAVAIGCAVLKIL